MDRQARNRIIRTMAMRQPYVQSGVGAPFFPVLNNLQGIADDNSSYALRMLGPALAGTYAHGKFSLKAGNFNNGFDVGLCIANAALLKTVHGSTVVIQSVPVTFGGLTLFTIPPGNTFTSDSIAMVFDNAHDYYFVVYVFALNQAPVLPHTIAQQIEISYFQSLYPNSPGPWSGVTPSSTSGFGSGDKTGVADVGGIWQFEDGSPGKPFWLIFSGATFI